MTFIWFIVWFISDHIGDREWLTFAPADWWAITLIGALALDLSSITARTSVRRRT